MCMYMHMCIVAFYVTWPQNNHWIIGLCPVNYQEQYFDAVYVLIINLLHNITNIYLCGGDILGNISDLASTVTITLALFA